VVLPKKTRPADKVVVDDDIALTIDLLIVEKDNDKDSDDISLYCVFLISLPKILPFYSLTRTMIL